MLLFALAAAEAVATRKGNPFASWGNRPAPNRIEPISYLTFEVPFALILGEPTFKES
jgi:hypothetical protein